MVVAAEGLSLLLPAGAMLAYGDKSAFRLAASGGDAIGFVPPSRWLLAARPLQDASVAARMHHGARGDAAIDRAHEARVELARERARVAMSAHLSLEQRRLKLG